ncbi:hypothetical protein [Desulfuromonas sp. TF]|uniref:hypothetical protein n=1 Tax=Desulfuromonas sp. TF TaxID=1232410 RepID=UPI0006879DDE|nr:hypothetical protein [Desulfuromonas sp. TF]
MPFYREAISSATVTLSRRDLTRMIRVVRTLYRLSRLEAYRQRILPQVPEAARFNPGHDAVMMGYDFHLTPQGPRLIEVNTNAGGVLLAYLSHFPDSAAARSRLPERLVEKVLTSFSEEMQGLSRGSVKMPETIAILDEEPEKQYLYQEMVAFVELFEKSGIRATIVDPGGLAADAGGVAAGGERIDLIYNRHCDFYLDGSEMSGIRAAYLAGNVCLTPNPFTYGLLADKRRLALWSDPEALASFGLDAGEIEVLAGIVPESRLLCDTDAEDIWRQRKDWVFKPVSRFGSRGVLLGRKISRTRFDELPPGETLVQRHVPPSMTDVEGDEPMKTDLRLYVYRTHVLGVAARLYHGQVTNLRTAGGGFAPVKVRAQL